VRIVAEKAAEPLTVETEGVTFKVMVRPIGKTRWLESDLRGRSDGSSTLRKAGFALVQVLEATAADGPLVVAMSEDGEDLPATDARTWPALLERFDDLAFGVAGRAQEMGDQLEAQRKNSLPASA